LASSVILLASSATSQAAAPGNNAANNVPPAGMQGPKGFGTAGAQRVPAPVVAPAPASPGPQGFSGSQAAEAFQGPDGILVQNGKGQNVPLSTLTQPVFDTFPSNGNGGGGGNGSGGDVVGGGGYGGWTPATATGSYAYGEAAQVNAMGRYSVDQSVAEKNNQEAYAQKLDNSTDAVTTYFSNRELNRKYRFGDPAERAATTADEAARFSKAMAPSRATDYEVEPVFGTVYWPSTLRSDEFALLRMKVEELFKNRDVATAGVGTVNYQEVVEATDALQEGLKGKIDELPPKEYIQAKKFLKTLAYEAQFAPQIRGVASR